MQNVAQKFLQVEQKSTNEEISTMALTLAMLILKKIPHFWPFLKEN
jgi:hypothetical protein